MALEEFNHFFGEAELTTEKRNKLDDSEFGIPEERKYPLYDKQHVLSAVTYFGKAEAKYKPELARRIVKRAKELNIEWYQWFDSGKSMSGYLKDLPKSYQNEYKNHSDKKQIKESEETKVLSDTPESSDIVIKFAKAGITYDNTGHNGPNKWVLKSPDEIFDKQKANCHDSAYYVFKQLHPKYKCGMLFFIEYNPDTGEAGSTHTVCYEKVNDYVVGIELSYKDYGTGTFPFNDVKELAESYARTWVLGKRYNSLLCLDIKDINGIHPGMTLDQYVKYVMNHSTEVFDKRGIIKEAYDVITGKPIDLGEPTMTEEEMCSRMVRSSDITTGVGDYNEFEDHDPDDCYSEYTMNNKEYNKLKNDIIDILGKLPTEYHQMLFSYQSTGFIKINRKYILLDSFKGKHIDDKISIKTLYNPEELYDSLIKDEHKSNMYKIGTLNPDGYIYYKPTNQMFYIDKNGERINVGTDKDLFVKMINESGDCYCESEDINGLVNINMIVYKIHDKCEEDGPDNNNCLLCSWCAESWMRGHDLLPRPVYSPRDPALEIFPEDVIDGALKYFRLSGGFDKLISILKSVDVSFARWYCHVKWSDGHGGHEFLIVKINNKFYVMDAQAGTIEPITKKCYYFKNIIWEQSYICRIDDKRFNYEKFKEINDPKNTIPWNGTLDIPYMLKEGMLTEREAEQYWKDHPDEKPIQEGAWNDIKNGVNPFSKKLWFHVTKQGHYDGQIFKPRVPDYLGKYDPDDPYFEDSDNPRICFSNSIEGALNAILVNIGRWKTADKLGDWYVYIPEKPIDQYKHKTTKELVKEKKVYDANVTHEIWIEEPVRLKQYGIIHIDQVSDKSRVKTVPSPTGKQTKRNRYSFKWHWLVKPKILKDLPYDYSPSEVCKDIESEMWKCKYGLNVDGRIRRGNVSEDEFDKLWRLASPDEFDQAGGGNCDDFVSWESGYLDTYGVSQYNKYFMDFGNNHHSFIIVKDNDKFIFVDGSLRHIVKDTPMRKEFNNVNECFDFVIDTLKKKDSNISVKGVYDFTKEKIDYGTPMKEYINWIKSHGKEIKYNKQIKEVYSMDNFERDPSVLKMIMEEDVFNENISADDSIQEAATQQFITGFKALRFYLETILKKLGYQVTNDNYQPLVFKVKKDSLTTTIDGSDGKGCKIVTRDLNFNMYTNANGMSLSKAKQVLPEFFKDDEQARTEPIHVSKYLTESDDNTDDSDTNEIDDASFDLTIDDSDGVGDALGVDNCTIQNQYDPKEIEELNKLISSEADAISDYFTGSKETRIPVLSKLYSDIGEEERFHLEQLLYAKSTITGEKYEPRDPKVRSEYEELLELGMDEETAMTTAVDKLSISVSVPDDEMTEQEEEELKESFDMLLSLSKFVSLTVEPMLETVINENEIKDNLFNEYTNIIEEMYVMEEVDNLNRKSSSVDLGSGNPIKMVLSAFRSIYKIIIAIVKRAKTAFLKVRLKDKRRWAWLKKHGIKGLFQKGVYLYFYSDKRNKYEVGQALTFIEIINQMNNKIVQQCKLNINTSKYNIDGYLRKLSDIEKAPIDKASILQRIKGASLEDGMRDLQGMVLQKTKLVVTDANEAYLEELFFGYTDKKYNVIMNDQEGNEKNVDISMNIYNQLDIALSALEITGNETNVILEELEKLEGQGGIYAEKPKVYNSAVRAASQMVKSIQKFVNAMTSDIKTIFDLNRGLKEIVDKIESVDSTKEEKAEGRKELKDYNDANQERKEEARKAVDERDNKNTTTKIRV